MRVVLVHPAFSPKAFSENLPFVDREFIKGPPVILAYVASIMQAAGHHVSLIDAHNRGLSAEQVLCQVRRFSPELICFRTESYHWTNPPTAGGNAAILLG